MRLDNMENLSSGHILMSLFLSSGGTVGGWALTGKLAGDDAALSFMQAGSIAVLAILCAQIIFFNLGKNRLIYRVVFNVAFGCGIVWFMLCLLLPILWVPSVGVIEKTALFLILLILAIANISKAGAQFAARWKDKGEKALILHYNSKDKTIDWPKVLAPMRLSLELYIPGIPEKMSPFISAAIIIFMLSGLSLRNVYPIFSLYAWGVPSCLVISMFAQVLGLGFAQIIKLAALEKRFGTPVGPKS
jgi:hypothetical protein